jgi:hypothetical protein
VTTLVRHKSHNRLNYSSADVASYINQNLAGLNLPTDANISADLVQSLYTPPPASTTSPDALLQGFNNAMASGDFNAASNIVSQATQIYGPETAANLTNYLGLPPGFAATGFTLRHYNPSLLLLYLIDQPYNRQPQIRAR